MDRQGSASGPGKSSTRVFQLRGGHLTSAGNAPTDVLAILTDLKQQIADPTGIVATQQHTVHKLRVVVQSPSQAYSQSDAPAVRQPPSGAAPSAAAPSALRSARDVPVGA